MSNPYVQSHVQCTLENIQGVLSDLETFPVPMPNLKFYDKIVSFIILNFPPPRLAETPECWNWQLQQDEIFADNFLIFADTFSYYIRFTDVCCRHLFSICRYKHVTYSFKREFYEYIMLFHRFARKTN